MTTTFLNLPPHLLPSSTPPLSGTPSGQNTSSPPPLLNSSPPPLSGTPSGQNTSSPPLLLNSAALWYPQWTKYLLTSSPLQLRCSLAAHVDKIPPQLCHSLAPQVAPTMLSGSPSGPHPTLWHTDGALWRL